MDFNRDPSEMVGRCKSSPPKGAYLKLTPSFAWQDAKGYLERVHRGK